MGLCVPYIHSDRYSFSSAWLRQKGAEMKVYELDKSTGELIWTDKEITPQKIKELKSVSEELDKILYESHIAGKDKK
jgi:hypothetical protein